MTLLTGSRIGAYDILSKLGEGGMGEVYRAHDRKLNRDVALKVLLPEVADDPERLARFRREAQILASLNHPNIGHIYGLEESDGIVALVMELVDGDDLSQRIAKGAIPTDGALPIAKQIAEALEAAHEQGIIHRDLKPANIKVRADGTVKVLDFGLAKAIDAGAGKPGGPGRDDLSTSPTLTSPALMTSAGIILGTAAYMSPEQARGTAADKRADIWAFGVVLWEMLTGTRPFAGATVSDTIALVLTAEPPWSALAPATPDPIRRLLRRCLEKDRKRRLHSAGDAALELDEASTSFTTHGRPVQGSSRRVPWAAVAALNGALIVALAGWTAWRQPAQPRLTRLAIPTPEPAAVSVSGVDRHIAVTPDGTRVIYAGNLGTQIFVRPLDSLDAVAIAAGSQVRGPFVSPDGQWVGFSDSNTIRKVAISGGPVTTLATIQGLPVGATWAPDNTIIFGTNTFSSTAGLQRVSADGGTPQLLTSRDRAHGESSHLWPVVLPGGHHLLFTITAQTGGLDAAVVALLDLQTGQHTVLVRGGTDARFVEPGHLVYVAAGGLRAVRFDPERLAISGGSVPVLPRLITNDTGAGEFATAPDGSLVYVDAHGAGTLGARTLVWVDRAGKEELLDSPPRPYLQPRLSPEGKRVAVWINDPANDVWMFDLEQKTLAPLTLDPGEEQHPVWTPDGTRIIYSATRGGERNLWWQQADGGGGAEPLSPSSANQFASAVTPDGNAVVFFGLTGASGGRDLQQLALRGPRVVTPLLQSPSDEREAVVSPDGHWLAYQSNQSGKDEIYVRTYPPTEGNGRRVSEGGGTRALWSHTGSELFYLSVDGVLMRVPVQASGSSWRAGTAAKVLNYRYYTGSNSGRSYDVSLDDQRFLMLKEVDGPQGASASPLMMVVQHWDQELNRLVAGK